MEKWIVLGGWVVVAIASAGIGDECKERFGYRLFSKWSLAPVFIGDACVAFGDWMNGVLKPTQDHPIGWTWIAAGVIVLAVAMVLNIRKTSFWFGLCGTVCQVLVVFVLIPVAIVLIPLKISRFFVGISSEQADEDDDRFVNPANANSPYHRDWIDKHR